MNILKTLFLKLSAVACLLMAFTALTACHNDDDEPSSWKDRNAYFFYHKYDSAVGTELVGDSRERVLTKGPYTDEEVIKPERHVALWVYEEGKGKGCPQPTDSVKVHIKGYLLSATSYHWDDETAFFFSYQGKLDTATCQPATFSADGKMANSAIPGVEGLGLAFQNMHIGDHWTVYVPQELGYGATGCSDLGIPPYSTLIYDITLVDY